MRISQLLSILTLLITSSGLFASEGLHREASLASTVEADGLHREESLASIIEAEARAEFDVVILESGPVAENIIKGFTIARRYEGFLAKECLPNCYGFALYLLNLSQDESQYEYLRYINESELTSVLESRFIKVLGRPESGDLGLLIDPEGKFQHGWVHLTEVKNPEDGILSSSRLVHKWGPSAADGYDLSSYGEMLFQYLRSTEKADAFEHQLNIETLNGFTGIHGSRIEFYRLN